LHFPPPSRRKDRYLAFVAGSVFAIIAFAAILAVAASFVLTLPRLDLALVAGALVLVLLAVVVGATR